MSKSVPDFDAEKRRRWYAVSLAAAVATSSIAISLIAEGVGNADEIGVVVIFWIALFVPNFASAYAIWYSPYSGRIRAVLLSVVSVLMVALVFVSCGWFFVTSTSGRGHMPGWGEMFIDFFLSPFSIAYLAAAIVGWLFAKPPPDVREEF